MSFYRWAMRSASVILFVFAILELVLSFGVQVTAYGAAGSFGPYGPRPAGLSLIGLLAPLLGAIGSAMWPLFGAALLWRIDRWVMGSASAPGGVE